jgi:hypothetical protein
MRNELTKRPVSHSDLAIASADPFEAYADAIAPRYVVGTLLKFSKGDYLAGEEGKLIAPGTKFTANLDEMLVGWIKWEGGKPVEHRMVRVADGVAPAKRSDLGEQDEALWELDSDKQPKDPWQFTNYLPLMNSDGELFTFSTNSRGGINAIGDLARRYARHRRRNPDVHPVIALDIGSYQHKNKEYGRIKFPQLTPAGYEPKAKFTEAMEAAGLAVSASVGEATTDDKKLNDEIPF